MRKSSKGTFSIALGAVSCSFRREIKPYEKFEMWTRILSWDRKWLYIVTHLIRECSIRPRVYALYPHQRTERKPLRKSGRTKEAIVASAVGKCVFKNRRLTIPPQTLLRDSGLLPPQPAHYGYSQIKTSATPLERSTASELLDSPFKAVEKLDDICSEIRKSLNPKHEETSRENGNPAMECTWEHIEKERRRGMEIANHLTSLDAVDGEFKEDTEVLGRCDGIW